MVIRSHEVRKGTVPVSAQHAYAVDPDAWRNAYNALALVLGANGACTAYTIDTLDANNSDLLQGVLS